MKLKLGSLLVLLFTVTPGSWLGISSPHLQGALAFAPRAGELRNLAGFDSISAEGAVDVHLVRGAPFRVEVVTYDDDAQVATEVNGATLVIRQERVVSPSGALEWGRGAEVRITLPRLRSIHATEGAEVDMSADGFGADVPDRHFTVVATGGASVDATVVVDRLEATVSGGSHFGVRGSAKLASFTVDGGSDFDGTAHFTAEQVTVESSGGSEASVHVTQRLHARAMGGSEISYAGNPLVVNVDANRGSMIRRRSVRPASAPQ